MVSEDADILGNKKNIDWFADDVVVTTSTPGTLAADVMVFESEYGNDLLPKHVEKLENENNIGW